MNKDIKTQYNNFSDTYSQNLEVQNELSNSMFHEIIDFDVRNKKILDVGCGDGIDLKKIQTKVLSPTAVIPVKRLVKCRKIINKMVLFGKG